MLRRQAIACRLSHCERPSATKCNDCPYDRGMSSLRIGIVGAGAIGGWLAARLSAADHQVSVLARDARLAAIRANGLTLRAGAAVTRHAVSVSDDPNSLGVQDIVIIAVKAQALASVASAVGCLVGTDTIVVPMLNGVPWWFLGRDVQLKSVDPDSRVAQHIPYGSVLGCVVHAAASSPTAGVVDLKMADRLIIGEPLGGQSDRLAELASALAGAQCAVVQSADIRQDIWYKLWGNMTINPVSALTLSTADKILDDELVRHFITQVMEEARAIGERIGCPLQQSSEARHGVTRKLGAFKSSMLQDLEAGRHIELDALLAAPREIAARVGVATPLIDALFGLTRLMARSRNIYS